jgi:hypothetical protein
MVPPHKEPEAPVRPPRLGLLLVRRSGKEKARSPRNRLSPLADASSLKLVAQFRF